MHLPHEFPSFKEYLLQLPAEVVFKHFLSHAGQSRKILSSSSVNDIAHKMSMEKSVKERFSQLPHEAKYLCSLVYLFGKRGYKVHAVSGFDDILLASFLVYVGKDEHGSTHYYGFPEFEMKLALLLGQTIIENSKKSPTPMPDSHSSFTPFYLCLCDIVLLCVFAASGVLKLTKKGIFAKNAETAMKKFLHASHDLPQDVSQRLIATLFSYALSRGLIGKETEGYCCVFSDVVAWLSLPLAERYRDFYDFSAAAFPLWSDAVLSGAFQLSQGHCIGLENADVIMEKDSMHAMYCLSYIGRIKIVGPANACCFLQNYDFKNAVAPQSLPGARIILLADFSVILTQEVLPEELFWFSKAGYLESYDQVYKGKISRQTINDSLSDGASERDILFWFETWKAPANVLSTVREWIREFSRLYISNEAIIVSVEERATKQLLSYEPLEKLLEPVMAHTLFRIRPGKEGEVRHILDTMGFDPRMPKIGSHKRGAHGADDVARAIAYLPRVIPLVSFDHAPKNEARQVVAGKYGQKLKQLDIGDLLHVLDYAALMGHAVSFEYAGSPLVKKGMHKVIPLAVHKSGQPYLEAQAIGKTGRKKFLLKCILKIGVEQA